MFLRDEISPPVWRGALRPLRVPISTPVRPSQVWWWGGGGTGWKDAEALASQLIDKYTCSCAYVPINTPVRVRVFRSIHLFVCVCSDKYIYSCPCVLISTPGRVRVFPLLLLLLLLLYYSRA